MMTLDQMQTSPAKAIEHTQAPGKKLFSHLLAIAVLAVGFHPFTLTKPAAVTEPIVNAACLPNFHVVDPYLFRGASPNYEGLVQLKNLGVKTIIDLRQDQDHIAWERAYTKQLGIEYVSVPMGNFVPSLYKQRTFFNVVGDAATKPGYGRVFVHCSHGSDRTGFFVALWRMKHDHWSIAEAVAEMLRYGFLVHKIK